MAHPIRLYNSMTRRVEPFEPRDPEHVQMFVCGPTVYEQIHIGNARTFTIFDVLARWLRYRGYGLTYLMNITDIDDRIIVRAAERNEDPLEYARRYEQVFREDMASLGNDAVDQFARATDHIEQVRVQVKTLRDRGFAYLIEGDGWYFDLARFTGYGKLSGRTELADEDAVSRIDESVAKRNPGDFCVWKLSKPPSTGSGQVAEPSWEDTELGNGRPGWHIEDTAITEHYFGPQYDLHGGGIDLKFPHHEAEIAQQESASGLSPFVRHWMHAGFLQLSGRKMSKSEGNIMPLRDALERYGPASLRFFLLSALWSEPLEASEKSMDAAAAAVQRIGEVAAKLKAFDWSGTSGEPSLAQRCVQARTAIESAMDENLNTPRAFGALFELIQAANEQVAAGALSTDDASAFGTLLTFVSDTFGIVPEGPAEVPDEVQQLVDEREQARGQKDFATADQLRDQLRADGWTVDDTPYGPLIKKVSD